MPCVRKPASLRKNLPLGFKCWVQIAVRTRSCFPCHIKLEMARYPNQLDSCAVRCRRLRIASQYFPKLFNSSCWCVKLLPSFLLKIPKDHLLFLLAWGSSKAEFKWPVLLHSTFETRQLFQDLCSCRPPHRFYFVLSMFWAPASELDSIVPAMLLEVFCLGADADKVSCWHEAPAINTCLCITKYPVSVLLVLIKDIACRNELIRNLRCPFLCWWDCPGI